MAIEQVKATGQNISTAVMQRRVEAHDSLDDFPTPPWATRAICEWLSHRGLIDSAMLCREPAANRGFMARPLGEYFASVEASDVHDYGCGYLVRDYLFGADQSQVDWTFTNPPFRLAQQFIERGIRTSRIGMAVIVRSAFVEGQGRFETLFRDNPPAWIVQHSERVPMVKGRYDPDASTATAYCWLVWLNKITDKQTGFAWLPPCKTQLFRSDDAMLHESERTLA